MSLTTIFLFSFHFFSGREEHVGHGSFGGGDGEAAKTLETKGTARQARHTLEVQTACTEREQGCGHGLLPRTVSERRKAELKQFVTKKNRQRQASLRLT
jgi:hypothetical protein